MDTETITQMAVSFDLPVLYVDIEVQSQHFTSVFPDVVLITV